MRIEDFTFRELDERVERSARVRWGGGEDRLEISVPAGLEAPEHDASAFLAACLLPAMLRGEDLEIDGAVSARLLAASAKIRTIYATWLPGLTGGNVTAAEELGQVQRGERLGSFLSRGIDSSYSMSCERHPPIAHAVFVDGIEPMRDAEGRREEVRRVAEMTDVAALPLVVAETNIKRLIDPLLTDGSDMMAAMLAFAGLSLAGGFGTLVIPSSGSYMALSPAGTHPLLDPLFSTESVTFEHDDIALTRVAKARWLVENRPELLPYIKVCYAEDRPDNCGRCLKCLFTMAALQAVGGLRLADGFPNELDLDLLDSMRVDSFEWIARFGANATVHALAPDGEQGRTREAFLRLLRRADPHGDPYVQEPTNMRLAFAFATTSINRDGRPYPPLPDAPVRTPPRSYGLGLVRCVDRLAGRHVYGVGSRPPGEPAGELGVLVDGPGEGRVPVWIDEHGRLLARGYAPAAPRPSPRMLARWLLAPLSWRGVAPLSRRARAVPERLRLLAVGRPPAPVPPDGAPPVGFILAEDRHGLIPLWSGVHPVTGDQLLCSEWAELNGMGYVDECLLGWLEPHAPVTGGLGSLQPLLPWASHFGRRRTGN